jgi:glutathione S-transferase
MRLIGMLDSPYVRRTAIGLDLLGVPFTHEAVSVFNHFQRFTEINPVVKAPTLVFDDGKYMMDSSLILEFFESQVESTLWAKDPSERRLEARSVSLALAACEKSVQAVYELNLRPKERHHQPWLDRLTQQRNAAFGALEAEVERHAPTFTRLSHASIAAAIAFQFAHSELKELVDASGFPHLARHSEKMEALPIFLKYPPVGPGVQPS